MWHASRTTGKTENLLNHLARREANPFQLLELTYYLSRSQKPTNIADDGEPFS